MGVCFKCDEEKEKLFDIISEEGIMNLCADCIQDDVVPIVKKPFEGAFEDTNSKKSVYERLSSVAGINPNKYRKFGEEDEEKDLQDAELKELVSQNLGFDSGGNLDLEVDLIRNFHWIIMRARRLKKLTLSELARRIAEPEEILKMVEGGDVSKANFELINKLELFFGIQVLTNEIRKKIVEDKKISFDKVISQSLTIDDLREMEAPEGVYRNISEEMSTGGKEEDKDVFEEEEEKEIEPEVKEPIKKDYSGDLSKKDIDDIIFGRK